MGGTGPKVVGSPQSVADQLETWMDETDLDGFNLVCVFSPNYFYMETVEWIGSGPSSSWYPQRWATRNIANIKSSALASVSTAPIFVDESTTHHSGNTDIYGRNTEKVLPPKKDRDPFSYADGHVETKIFNDLRGYLSSLGDAVPQTQFGISFESTPLWPLRDDLPDAIR